MERCETRSREYEKAAARSRTRILKRRLLLRRKKISPVSLIEENRSVEMRWVEVPEDTRLGPPVTVDRD